jgi:hypothetical protein
MWQALGGLLPIAVAVAISSVPITATILILLSPNRNVAALPFLIGSVIGVAGVIVLSAFVTSALPKPPRLRPDLASAALFIVIGLALVVLGIVNLRRSARTEKSGIPRWLSRVGSFGALVSFAVAVLLGFRPKGLLLGMAAGLVLRGANVDAGQDVALVVIYTVIATSTVIVPITASFVARRRVEPRLIAARDWLTDNGRILTSLMMSMIGVVIFGAGLIQL